MAGEAIDVFISSTCEDLADLRGALAEYLKDNDLEVRVSEDVNSAFFIEPTAGAISSCLANLEASHVVVCIIDRRYGNPLHGQYGNQSATHVEISHARKLNKPVFFFVREPAWSDYHLLAESPGAHTRWVEKDDRGNRGSWVEFVNEVAAQPKHDGWSNWCDRFTTVVDLKRTVLRRIVQKFPEYAGRIAMRPDRLVRLAFLREKHDSDGNIVGCFKNVGVGPALRITHGISGCKGNGAKDGVRCWPYGGLREGDGIMDINGQPFTYDIPAPSSHPPPYPMLFSEYYNRFGDRYRVEVPLEPFAASMWYNREADKFLVWHGTKNDGGWSLMPF